MSIARFNSWQGTDGTTFGTVLQVAATTVNAVASTSNTDASGIGGDVGLNVTITPKSSNSKFLITVHIGSGTNTGGNSWVGILSRDGTKVGNGDADANHPGILFRSVDHAGNTGTDVNHGVGASGYYMDNTSGTKGSPITYKCGITGESSTSYINRCEGDLTSSTAAYAGRTSSTITVTEIAK